MKLLALLLLFAWAIISSGLRLPQFSGISGVARTIQLKEELRSLCRGTQNGVKCSVEKREQISKLASMLQKSNKTKKLTSSPLLDKSWSLLYTTNAGSSAGKIGPFVGSVEQDIRLSEKFYTNYVRIPFFTAFLTATWDNLSNSVWRVNFQTIAVEIFGIKVVEKPLKASGIWRMTYLDEDLRILFAAGQDLSKGPVIENIYILGK